MAIPKILIIDDDPFILDVYHTKLIHAGYEVETAKNGEDGLKKIHETKPNLVLLDIMMPDLNGIELLKKIRSDASFAAMKIVLLSNLDERDQVDATTKKMIDGYLLKADNTPAQVLDIVTAFLPLPVH